MNLRPVIRAFQAEQNWAEFPGNSHQVSYWRIVPSPNGQIVATHNGSGGLFLFSIPSMQLHSVLHNPFVHSPKWVKDDQRRKQVRYMFSADSKRLLCLCDRGSEYDWDLHLWDVATGKLISTLQLEHRVADLRCGTNTIVILTGEGIQIIDLPTLTTVRRFAVEEYPRSIALSPDERTVATENISEVGIWSVETGTRVAQLNAEKQVDQIWFAPTAMKYFSGVTTNSGL